MDISVRNDKNMGDTKMLSVSAANPQDLSQRGVKVYDDVQKVVYEVCSRGTTSLENGIQLWSSSETDELMQLVGQTFGDGDGVVVTRSDPAAAATGTGEQTASSEANLDTALGSRGKGLPARPRNRNGDKAAPEASAEMPFTSVYMGEGMPRVLEFDGTVQGDVVLIDEDDDRSLREKTVTDTSATDGNAADLVAGRPASVSSELASEEKEESSVAELPLPVTQKKKCCRCCTVM
ncbi:paralemmin-1 [Conger conger]|uniref:paralemmin-1 n=1 Tax=Conger conger TaxID=82655 RepID=UPI002A59D0F6|nr:paralemmin-1 [Conger conger]XP_061117133.1 paralemmin-1 [Conger conger]